MRILFVPTLGKGFGHIKRAQLIAEQLKSIAPHDHISIIVDNIVAPLIDQSYLTPLVLPFRATNLYQQLQYPNGRIDNGAYQRLVHTIIDCSEPDIVVYDFILSEPILQSVLNAGGENVFVFRRQRDSAVRAFLTSGVLDMVSKVLIPHEARTFRLRELEGDGKAVNVGTIFEQPAICDSDRLKEQLGIPQSAFWVLVTCGGGGYLNESEYLMRIAADIADRARSIRPVIITFFEGIYSPSLKTQALSPVIRHMPFDPCLPSYFRHADLVVSYMGYNSYNEITHSGTTAILIPAARALDDQHSRPNVEGLTAGIHVCTSASMAVSKALEIIRLGSGRLRGSQLPCDSEENGAHRAARELLRLAHAQNAPCHDQCRAHLVPRIALQDFATYFGKQFASGQQTFHFSEHDITRETLTELQAFENSLRPLNLSYSFQLQGTRDPQVAPHSKSLLEHVNLRITSACNSRCTFCYHWRERRPNPHMPLLKVIDVANQSIALGAKTFVVNGGEPTLHPQFLEILDVLHSRNVRITVNTNGLRLHSVSFRDSLRRFPNLCLMITILSVQDVGLRGSTDWSGRTIGLIGKLKKAGVPALIRSNIVLCRQNFHQLRAMLDGLLDAGVDQITMNLVDSVRDLDFSSMYLSIEQLETLYFDIYPKLLFQAKIRSVNVRINPLFLRLCYGMVAEGKRAAWSQAFALARGSRSFRKELAEYSLGKYGLHFYGKVKHCSIPRQHAYVMANGDVYPCLKAIGSSDHAPLGNLYDRTMGAIVCSRQWSEYMIQAGQTSLCDLCNNAFVKNLENIYRSPGNH